MSPLSALKHVGIWATFQTATFVELALGFKNPHAKQGTSITGNALTISIQEG